MASITPLSALPANGTTPSGTLTLSNLQGRLTCFLTNGGVNTLQLITRTEGGNWAYVPGAVLVTNSANNQGDGVGVLDFDNNATTTLYHVVQSGGSSAASVWLSSLTGPGTSTALVAHASTHLAGGSDDLLGAPGTVGGTTPGVFCGTFGPDSSHQNTVPSKNGDTFSLLALAQTFSAVKTFSATPVFAAGATASGATSFDLSGSTATQKSTTGAQTIGGGAAAITATSSAAAITLTAGAASTWSTTAGGLTLTSAAAATWSTAAGALTVSGFSGINLQKAGVTLIDVGATSATAVTLAANISLSGAAGTGAVSLGSMTGDTALPTGAFSWAGAASKTGSIKAGTSAALTLGGNGASVASFDAGGLGFLLASGKIVGFGAPQALSGPGALNVTTLATAYTSTGAAEALTLANGTLAGQVKFVTHIVDGGSGVITPATASGFATCTLTAVRDWVAFLWTGAAWIVLAYSGATFA